VSLSFALRAEDAWFKRGLLESVYEACLHYELRKRDLLVERLSPIHEAQLLSYLRLSGVKLGLLINFNTEHLKDGIRRMVNGL